MKNTRRFIVSKSKVSLQVVTDFNHVSVESLSAHVSDYEQVIIDVQKILIKSILILHSINAYTHLMLYFDDHGWRIQQID